MTDLRLPLGDFCDAVTARALALEVQPASKEEPVCFIEVPVLLAIAGVYDHKRRHLEVPCAPTAKLSQLPAVAQALVCNYITSPVGERGTIVLLAPELGASFLLPRADSSDANVVRATAATDDNGGVVAVARGPDAYTALLDASKILADKTGMSPDQVHTYILPLLESISQLTHDCTLAAGSTLDATAVAMNSTSGDASAFSSATAQADVVQSVLEGVVVQAELGGQVHPLPTDSSLVLRQGPTKTLKLQYSGMSVVYGAATNHVLAVLETAAALKMVPSGGLRTVASSPVLVNSSSVASCGIPGLESPTAVSAGVSDTASPATSPSVMSRSNSSTAGPGEVLSSTLSGSFHSAAAATAVPLSATSTKVLSGRSITTAPIVEVLAAPATPEFDSTAAVFSNLSLIADIPGDMLASFALIGVKSAGAGRDAGVRGCRIMPSSALKAENPKEDLVSTTRRMPSARSDLGLVILAEVACNTAGKLLMFMEGAERDLDSIGDGAEGPVRHVTIDGRPAVWEYDSTGSMLTVDFPSAPFTTGPRAIQVYL